MNKSVNNLLIVCSESLLLKSFFESHFLHHTDVEVIFISSILETNRIIGFETRTKCILIDESIRNYNEEKIKLLEINGTFIRMALVNQINKNDLMIEQTLKDSSFTNLKNKLTSILNIETISLSSLGFIPFDILFFRYFKVLPCDIFLKIGKNTEAKFVKRFTKGDPIVEDDYKHLTSKTNYIWINSADQNLLLEEISNIIVRVQNNPDSILETLTKPDEIINKELELKFLMLKHYANVFGFDEKIIETSLDCLNLTQKWLNSQTLFSETLRKITSATHKKRVKKIQIISLFCANLLKLLETENTETNIQKYILTSIFCDIYLHDDYAAIRSDESLRLLNLVPHLQQLIKNHAYLTSERFSKLEAVPHEVVQMIKEHHGSMYGRGFPQKQDSFILPSSQIFNLADEIAEYVSLNEFANFNVAQFIQDLIEEKNISDNKKLVKALKELMVLIKTA